MAKEDKNYRTWKEDALNERYNKLLADRDAIREELVTVKQEISRRGTIAAAAAIMRVDPATLSDEESAVLVGIMSKATPGPGDAVATVNTAVAMGAVRASDTGA